MSHDFHKRPGRFNRAIARLLLFSGRRLWPAHAALSNPTGMANFGRALGSHGGRKYRSAINLSTFQAMQARLAFPTQSQSP